MHSRSQQSSPAEHPRIYTAERIHTLGADDSDVRAVLVVGGLVACIGDVQACEAEAARQSPVPPRVVDFTGATLLPGFIDAHAHPLMLGQLSGWADCSPNAVHSIPELIDQLRRFSQNLPADSPVRGQGYQAPHLAENRHPTRYELDTVSESRVVYVMNASGHGGVVNSFALEQLGIDRNTPDPEGGRIGRDADGDPNGEISDSACDLLTGIDGVKIGRHGPNFHLADDPKEHVEQLLHAQGDFLRNGVTTVADAQVTKREFETYLRVQEAGDLRMRVRMYLLSHALDSLLDIGMVRTFGNAMLAFQGVKFYADGAFGVGTAYFPDGYSMDPCRTGHLYHEPEDYRRMLAAVHAAGVQAVTHAQSPAAIAGVMDAVEAAQSAVPFPKLRHRIEHCGVPLPEQLSRIRDLGLIPVSQPLHHYSFGDGVIEAIGDLGHRYNPLGEFADAGIDFAISSDAPVAPPEPLCAIQAAVTRISRKGTKLGSDAMKLTVEQAVRAHTIGGAVALGIDDEVGTIEVGKRADFVVLDADPFAVVADDLGGIGVVATIVDGDVVFAR